MKTDRFPRRRAAGMTLIELLVAFMVLLMLVAALVALTTRSLDTWTTGEARKDVYDRGQVVLDAIASDLRNVYVENEFTFNGMKALMPPAFASDTDKNRRPAIRFVRTGNPARINAGTAAPSTIVPISYYSPTWEVAYVMDPDSAQHILYRGVRPFDRSTTSTLFRPQRYSAAEDSMFRSSFTAVEAGILYVGYKFWTQFTTTWDDGYSVTKVGAKSTQKSGPERRWDSTRMEDRNFYLYRKAMNYTNPDFVYPEIVEVTVTVELGSPETSGIRLAGASDDKNTSYLSLTHTRGMLDGPALVKIDGEWIEYADKTLTELVKLRRGQRGTLPASHSQGTAVRFGETFTTEVRLPAYREAQEP